MKEDFLHYLWKFQKFSKVDLRTVSGESLLVNNTGIHNHNSGPDFLMAQIELEGQIWVGQVELHLESSLWFTHEHDQDLAYDNVILHVVWTHDKEVCRKDGSTVPVLELKGRVDPELLLRYEQLSGHEERFIPCEPYLNKVEDVMVNSWLWRLYVERLEEKTEWIQNELNETGHHWEAVLFRILSRNFGLTVNAESFLSIAKSIDYAVIQKCSTVPLKLEALLMGQAGFLQTDSSDPMVQKMMGTYNYLKTLYPMNSEGVNVPKFFRLRPPNFPTLRLSQLANLWSGNPYLFSQIIKARTKEELYLLFETKASSYWDTHYTFQRDSQRKEKNLTRKFKDLLIINTVIPLKFIYGRYFGNNCSEAITDLALSIDSEKNKIVSKFNEFRDFESSAWHSQALLQLKTQYCEQFKCMHCEIGNAVLRQGSEPKWERSYISKA